MAYDWAAHSRALMPSGGGRLEAGLTFCVFQVEVDGTVQAEHASFDAAWLRAEQISERSDTPMERIRVQRVWL